MSQGVHLPKRYVVLKKTGATNTKAEDVLLGLNGLAQKSTRNHHIRYKEVTTQENGAAVTYKILYISDSNPSFEALKAWFGGKDAVEKIQKKRTDAAEKIKALLQPYEVQVLQGKDGENVVFTKNDFTDVTADTDKISKIEAQNNQEREERLEVATGRFLAAFVDLSFSDHEQAPNIPNCLDESKVDAFSGAIKAYLRENPQLYEKIDTSPTAEGPSPKEVLDALPTILEKMSEESRAKDLVWARRTCQIVFAKEARLEKNCAWFEETTHEGLSTNKVFHEKLTEKLEAHKVDTDLIAAPELKDDNAFKEKIVIATLEALLETLEDKAVQETFNPTNLLKTRTPEDAAKKLRDLGKIIGYLNNHAAQLKTKGEDTFFNRSQTLLTTLTAPILDISEKQEKNEKEMAFLTALFKEIPDASNNPLRQKLNISGIQGKLFEALKTATLSFHQTLQANLQEAQKSASERTLLKADKSKGGQVKQQRLGAKNNKERNRGRRNSLPPNFQETIATLRESPRKPDGGFQALPSPREVSETTKGKRAKLVQSPRKTDLFDSPEKPSEDPIPLLQTSKKEKERSSLLFQELPFFSRKKAERTHSNAGDLIVATGIETKKQSLPPETPRKRLFKRQGGEQDQLVENQFDYFMKATFGVGRSQRNKKRKAAVGLSPQKEISPPVSPREEEQKLPQGFSWLTDKLKQVLKPQERVIEKEAAPDLSPQPVISPQDRTARLTQGFRILFEADFERNDIARLEEISKRDATPNPAFYFFKHLIPWQSIEDPQHLKLLTMAALAFGLSETEIKTLSNGKTEGVVLNERVRAYATSEEKKNEAANFMALLSDLGQG